MDRLFTYGSLRDGGWASPVMENIQARLIEVGVPTPYSGFDMIDLGAYPAVFEAEEPDDGWTIIGDVFEIPDPGWFALDQFESAPHLFKRTELEEGLFMYVFRNATELYGMTHRAENQVVIDEQDRTKEWLATET